MRRQLRDRVRLRARDRCEYCRLPQIAVELPFHIEHIVARQHGGGDDLRNLALACDRCNLNKGTNLAAVDQKTKEVVRLYHPRHQRWVRHFKLHEARIDGQTANGRATSLLLKINATRRVRLRRRLIATERW